MRLTGLLPKAAPTAFRCHRKKWNISVMWKKSGRRWQQISLISAYIWSCWNGIASQTIDGLAASGKRLKVCCEKLHTRSVSVGGHIVGINCVCDDHLRSRKLGCVCEMWCIWVHKGHVFVVADTISDPMSCDTLAPDDAASLHDAQSDVQQLPTQKQPQIPDGIQQAQRPLRLDILPPPPNTNSTRKSPMVHETPCVESGHLWPHRCNGHLLGVAVVKVSVVYILGRFLKKPCILLVSGEENARKDCDIQTGIKFNVGFLASEDGTVRLSRNVGKKLPLLAA